ncbi:hypothetical protein K2173_013601 [Erythroxylum novogranatense]|uniref:Uncharacterized protein n=1 Tax=Erythroxylum novogranatense TaxID=1862640 RepID=A0AAV8TMQ0_9ROSI|nr:hypothetical protein K2173_013601 [Erythroxylum novogranatense]
MDRRTVLSCDLENCIEQEVDKVIMTGYSLIVGRIAGRKAEEIERFWLMRHGEVFASRRKQLKKSSSGVSVSLSGRFS